MASPEWEPAVHRYLRLADQLMPGRVGALYVVGSIALGAYRPGRSDMDLVAVLDGDLDAATLARLRVLHLTSGAVCAVTGLRRHRSPFVGTCNTAFVLAADVTIPVTELKRVALHIGTSFLVGKPGSDVSPVGWKVLVENGISVRGPEAATLGFDPEPALLRSWNLGNLASYWGPWASTVRDAPTRTMRRDVRRTAAWGVLGAPRLHCTASTGNVISKEQAGFYALKTFDTSWHELIHDAMAHCFDRSARPLVRVDPAAHLRQAGEFVAHVCECALATV
jgi:Nucleotidyltransferase domain/Domain of unknown function (DUF4111)